MATSITKGILKNKIMVPDQIHIYDIDGDKRDKLVKETSVIGANNNEEVFKNSSLIIIAVKPQAVDGVLCEISDYIENDHTLISIAAGISTSKIQSKLQKPCKVIRVMPNTPTLVGEGMSAICNMGHLGEEERNMIISIFSALGKVEEVNEEYMDAITAISGSSPAYGFMFIEAIADGGVLMGLPRDLSYRLAAQSVLGAAKMVLESGDHPGVLKDKVSSPGGTTIEAVYRLEKGGFRGIVMDAVKACALKAKDMEES